MHIFSIFIWCNSMVYAEVGDINNNINMIMMILKNKMQDSIKRHTLKEDLIPIKETLNDIIKIYTNVDTENEITKNTLKELLEEIEICMPINIPCLNRIIDDKTQDLLHNLSLYNVIYNAVITEYPFEGKIKYSKKCIDTCAKKCTDTCTQKPKPNSHIVFGSIVGGLLLVAVSIGAIMKSKN
jgi:hypothetical protein